MLAPALTGAFLCYTEIMSKRVLLKLSGEMLAGAKGAGFELEAVKDVARQIKALTEEGVQVGIVVGGGNFWRGRTGNEIDRTKSDAIGMLATVLNAIYVADILRSEGVKSQIFTPFRCDLAGIELFAKDRVNDCFVQGKVAFFAGGTGHPYFSTDTGVVLRAIEMEADEILLAKAIDGVYSADPNVDPSAQKYDEISLQEVVAQGLKVVDLTAATLAMENGMPFVVFAMNGEDSILKAARGQHNGTRVTA